MRMQTPKTILKQIDQAANTERQLGQVQLNRAITLNYTDKEDAGGTITDGVQIDVNWKKRYYLYDRGDYFPLDIYQFNNYFGKMYRTVVNGPNGNFIDYLEENWVNAHYSTEVYVAQDVTISTTISLTNGSLSIFINQIEALKSSTSINYISASQSFYLKKGWNTIDIFVYHKENNGILAITGDLGKRVTTWRSPDFTPPELPVWHTTPVETVYVDPTKTSALQNVLRWQNNKYNNPYSSVRGWGVYRREWEFTKDSGDNLIRVVSGWGDGNKQVVVTGDKRLYFPSDIQVQFGLSGAYRATVSGTNYTASRDQTNIILKGTGYTGLGGGLQANWPIIRWVYNHLFDMDYNISLPVVVSGFDTTIYQGQYCEYVLDSYDDSINKNRSEKTAISAWRSGDFTAPGKLAAADIVGTSSGFKRITCVMKRPEQWTNYSPDVRGLQVWLTANPDPENDIMVAELPLTVSGSYASITISNTIDSGLSVDLKDVTSYTFYFSTYDWFGNSNLSSLPSITASTSVKIRTRPDDEDSYMEIDSDTNTFKIYADL